MEPKSLANRHNSNPLPKTAQIEITRAHIEEKGFRVELTIVDTPGFGDGVNRTDAHAPIVKFLDDQHESYLRLESMAKRNLNFPVSEASGNHSGVVDMRVHACLYFISPHATRGLRQLDIQTMKALCNRVNLIPVIAKADTLAPRTLALLKDTIRKQISENEIAVYTCPIGNDTENGGSGNGASNGVEEDGEWTKRNIDLMSAMPFSVIGCADEVVTSDGRRVLARQYPWGMAEGIFTFPTRFNSLHM